LLNFLWIWLLAALPLPLIVHRFVPPAPDVQEALSIPFFDVVARITDSSTVSRNRLSKWLLILIWITVVIAAARPQWIGESVSLPVSGRDLMIAVDVSGSMKAQDMVFGDAAEDRLQTVKRVAGEFIRNRVGDRIGLILFGTHAYLQAPLTLDRKTAKILLNESEIGIAGEKTAIGDAIGLAIKTLKDRPDGEKVLILLTDGANTAGAIEPIQAAELAATTELKIHTIGIGADQRVVRNFFGQRVVNPAADLDEKTLSSIAELTGGRYFRATDPKELARIYDLIDRLEPVEDTVHHLRPTKELFYYPLTAALILSVLLALQHLGIMRPFHRTTSAILEPEAK